MKKRLMYVLLVLAFISCNKADIDQVSLTPSTTVASVGETISVTATSNTNAISWSVTPMATSSKQFAITTEKTNYFTFSKAGQYSIGVRARNISYDPSRNQSIDSCWRSAGADRGGCRRGVDSAAVTVTVK